MTAKVLPTRPRRASRPSAPPSKQAWSPEKRRAAMHSGAHADAARAHAGLAAGERTRLLKQVYKDTDLPNKPCNTLGLATDIPGAEIESRCSWPARRSRKRPGAVWRSGVASACATLRSRRACRATGCVPCGAEVAQAGRSRRRPDTARAVVAVGARRRTLPWRCGAVRYAGNCRAMPFGEKLMNTKENEPAAAATTDTIMLGGGYLFRTV